MNPHRFLESRVAPDKVLVLDARAGRGRKISAKDLLEAADRTAKTLPGGENESIAWDPGLPPQDDPLATWILLLACAMSGRALTILNARWPRADKKDHAEAAGFDWSMDASGSRRLSTGRPSVPGDFLLFTSGTSGRPKLAVFSWDALFASAESANRRIPLGPEDAWLATLPLWHVGGLGIWFRCLLAGARVALADKGGVPPEATHVSAVPSQLHAWRLDDAPAWRHRFRAILLGGASLPPAVLAPWLDKGAPLFASYGLTETSSQIATSPVKRNEEIALEPLPGTEWKLGADGEIRVKAPGLFRGYWKDGRWEDARDEEGFLPTRDGGALDATGRLRILGRMDFRINSGGEKIHPERIEAALIEGGAEEALVVGVPDEKWGERPWAYVRAERPDEVLAATRGRIPNWMIPDRLLPWPADAAPGLKPPRGAWRARALERRAKELADFPGSGSDEIMEGS